MIPMSVCGASAANDQHQPLASPVTRNPLRRVADSTTGWPGGFALVTMMKKSDRERFDEKWVPEPNTGCWLWTASSNRQGYGYFSIGRKIRGAHRASWELHRGPIPDGMVLDHLCRVPSCVNPDHLRVVTPRVNTLENSLGSAAQRAKQTHCKRGHPLSGDNVRMCGPLRRYRQCRLCMNIYPSRIYTKVADRWTPK